MTIWKTECFEKFLNKNFLFNNQENGVKTIVLLLAHLLIFFSLSGRQNIYQKYRDSSVFPNIPNMKYLDFLNKSFK